MYRETSSQIGSSRRPRRGESANREADPATVRSNRAEVRNPILALPAMAVLHALDPAARAALQQVLLDLQADARIRAEASWRSRKPPLAAYWAACGVYAGHIARAIGPCSRPTSKRRADVARPGRFKAKGRGTGIASG